jgi:hypothetical protein
VRDGIVLLGIEFLQPFFALIEIDRSQSPGPAAFPRDTAAGRLNGRPRIGLKGTRLPATVPAAN